MHFVEIFCWGQIRSPTFHNLFARSPERVIRSASSEHEKHFRTVSFDEMFNVDSGKLRTKLNFVNVN